MNPSLWASPAPFGVGQQRPNNFLEIGRAVRENADNLGYAWRILSQGCCDGCALGTAGLRDWTMDGVHLCNIRLRLLRLNTMGPLDPEALPDAAGLRALSGAELRDLGRIPHPLVRRQGDPGFTRLGWDEALDLAAARIAGTTPDRIGAYLTSRGMPNESYYAAQKAWRSLGSNAIDNAARVCHSPSTFGLKDAIGVGATTCSYADWLDADLILFVGSNVANNQPVATKYLYMARQRGTRVACVNPYREPGMERYWIPSVPESAVFGTRLTDRFFQVNAGGDLAFFTGVMRHLVDNGWVDRRFVDEHTTGFDELVKAVQSEELDRLEALSGASRHDMHELARMIHHAERVVIVWSMGVTQHAFGEDNVRALVNLGLANGFVGREGCGLMPIRGHSGVQGGAEMGCYSTAFPGPTPITEQSAAELSRRWRFDVAGEPGMTAPEMLDAAAAGALDVLWSCGGNFLDVLPDPGAVETALGRIPLRVHMDLVLSTQMLVDPSDTVLVLPAATRYEIPDGCTETSTERRIIYSPEVPGPRIAEARPECFVLGDLAARVRPDLADRVRFPSTQSIRDEIARVVPAYDGIQHLRRTGDSLQYGGAHLCAGWRFPTPDGKAHFSVVGPAGVDLPDGRFLLSTRRGKQFNSMVQERRDAITGAARESVLMNAGEARRLGLREGDEVVLRSDRGELAGRVRPAPIAPRNLQVHWPEGNVLIDPHRRSAEAGIPDFNAVVELLRADRSRVDVPPPDRSGDEAAR